MTGENQCAVAAALLTAAK